MRHLVRKRVTRRWKPAARPRRAATSSRHRNRQRQHQDPQPGQQHRRDDQPEPGQQHRHALPEQHLTAPPSSGAPQRAAPARPRMSRQRRQQRRKQQARKRGGPRAACRTGRSACRPARAARRTGCARSRTAAAPARRCRAWPPRPAPSRRGRPAQHPVLKAAANTRNRTTAAPGRRSARRPARSPGAEHTTSHSHHARRDPAPRRAQPGPVARQRRAGEESQRGDVDHRLGDAAPVQQEDGQSERRDQATRSSAADHRPSSSGRSAIERRGGVGHIEAAGARASPASASDASPRRIGGERAEGRARARGIVRVGMRAASPATSGRRAATEQTSAAPLAIASSAVMPNGSCQRLGTATMAARAIASSTAACGSSRRGSPRPPPRAGAAAQERGLGAVVGKTGRRRSSPPASPAAAAGRARRPRRRHPPPCRAPPARRTGSAARAGRRRARQAAVRGSSAARPALAPAAATPSSSRSRRKSEDVTTRAIGAAAPPAPRALRAPRIACGSLCRNRATGRRGSARRGRVRCPAGCAPRSAPAPAPRAPAPRRCHSGGAGWRRASGGGRSGGTPLRRRAVPVAPDPSTVTGCAVRRASRWISSAIAPAASGENPSCDGSTIATEAGGPLTWRGRVGSADDLDAGEEERDLGRRRSRRCPSRGPNSPRCSRRTPARMVPAAAFFGSVAPIMSRLRATAFSPSSTCTTTGPEIMKLTSSRKNGRASMHGVERLGLRLGQMQALLRDDAQAGGLEHGVDLAGEVPPGRVRLDDRERALDRHVGRSSGWWRRGSSRGAVRRQPCPLEPGSRPD